MEFQVSSKRFLQILSLRMLKNTINMKITLKMMKSYNTNLEMYIPQNTTNDIKTNM